jgi:hypothetical protein
MLRRAGFFHFVRSHCDPLGELTKAMDEVSPHTDVTDSLIVLPEAFNLGRLYDPNNTPKHRPGLDERCVLALLRATAERHKCVFVVSVIEVDTRLNSAYFVDASSKRLMCRKIMNDQSQEYAPCTSDCQMENPFRYSEQMYIGALICADALDNSRAGRKDTEAESAYIRLTSLQSELNGKRSVVCVPAYMKTTQSYPDTPRSGFILANSRPDSNSFISDRKGVRLVTSDGLQNQIHLVDICRLMAEQE